VKVFRRVLSNVSKLAPVNKDKLTIVSCSSLIPLKRVHLISEILKHISLPVDWFHFGTGEELQKIKNINTQLPPHINVKMMGYIENKKFIEYLENNVFSFFINVSENEGIPVSLMEAANCGIPLIGTSVCGIPEVVTQETGTLISLNFDPKEVAQFIEKTHLLGDIYKYENRVKIQNFCNNYFSAQKNHTQLAKFLSELN
jgi:glycosyltransferase involved in cell wall biosynthesis